MFYIIWVPNNVERLGIAADSEFKIYRSDMGEMSIADYMRSEFELDPNEYEVI